MCKGGVVVPPHPSKNCVFFGPPLNYGDILPGGPGVLFMSHYNGNLGCIPDLQLSKLTGWLHLCNIWVVLTYVITLLLALMSYRHILSFLEYISLNLLYGL